MSEDDVSDAPPYRDLTDGVEVDHVQVEGHRYVAHALVRRGDELLLLRRRAGRYLGGRWDVPGGTVEPGEDVRAAAVRETREESGLVVVLGAPLSHLANLDTEGRALCFHTVTFAATEPSPGPVVLSPTEHDAHTWLTPRQALELDLVWHLRATLVREAAR